MVNVHNIKQLRSLTGAGFVDCKEALLKCENNVEQAQDLLKKQGLAVAEKKSSRIAAEGLITSYIHTGSKIGVILELNCETDFVAKQSQFQSLAKDIAMQVAASLSVEYISIKDIPEKVRLYEMSIQSEKEDIKNKPQSVKDKIVEGRMEKRLKELSLMDQNFIKNSDISIEELIKQSIVIFGENIQIRRFKKFTLGQM